MVFYLPVCFALGETPGAVPVPVKLPFRTAAGAGFHHRDLGNVLNTWDRTDELLTAETELAFRLSL